MAKKRNKSAFGGRAVERSAPPAPVRDFVQIALPLPAPEPALDLVAVDEAMKLLGGISRSTLQRLERSGAKLGRVMIGGVLRYDRSVLLSWIRSKVSR